MFHMENKLASIKIDDLYFKPYIAESEIKKQINVISEKICAEYKDKKPLLLAILNGSFLFAADLIRELNIDCEITFIKASSYSGTKSTNELALTLGPSDDLKDRNVIIIEDIVDSGHSLGVLLPLIESKNPSSIKIASLLFKPSAFKGNFNVDYIGFEIPNDFIVGYGLDYNGLGRNLKDIYVIES